MARNPVRPGRRAAFRRPGAPEGSSGEGWPGEGVSAGPRRDSQSDVYDLIVAGAGLGGLSFLWHLLESSPEPRRVLVVDRSFEAAADRTWCFWGPEDAPFADLAQARWSQAEVRVGERRHEASLGELFYHCVPSEVFRQKFERRS